MADNLRFLIGHGEKLVTKVTGNSGSGDKAHPYSFLDNAKRLAPQMRRMIDEVDALPVGACPDDEAVVALTLHPTYLARSYHPAAMFQELGLRQVGSREKYIDPAKYLTKEPQHVAPELFVAGRRSAIRRLNPLDGGGGYSDIFRENFIKIEQVRALGDERIRRDKLEGDNLPLEVVLHVGDNFGENDRILSGFEAWCDQLEGVEVLEERLVGGLAFVNVRADEDSLSDLALFSFLRLARRMPRLAFRQMPFRTALPKEIFQVDIDHTEARNERVRVAVFDGGLASNHPFGGLAMRRELPGLGAPHPIGLEHGTMVTSAGLFGPITEGEELTQPYAPIEHWRVIDDAGDDFELTATLDRIVSVLEAENYHIANLSLGPDAAFEHDDVHVWTATLDQIAARNNTLVICAAGNNGEEDAAAGLNRVQPSSDGVNILAVGARDRLEDDWQATSYSAVGPGRSPGLIKPDCVAVGGTETDPFFAIREDGKVAGTLGTSFSAPTVSRLAAGIKGTFDRLTPTSIRALLIHTAGRDGNHVDAVGWGSVRHRLSDILVCADDEATVVFQGVLGIDSLRRYPIPCPAEGFKKKVAVTATFVVASPVDPEDAISYTQVGAQIFFRPDTTGDPGMTDGGKQRLHKTSDFFGQKALYQTEQELRQDAQHWEAVKRRTRTFNSSTLKNPVFDVQHHARSHGGKGTRMPDVAYALIVTLREKDNTDLYDGILRAHASLRAMIPGITVSVGTD